MGAYFFYQKFSKYMNDSKHLHMPTNVTFYFFSYHSIHVTWALKKTYYPDFVTRAVA